MAEPPIANVHTPTSSFAVVHSLATGSLKTLYDTLTRKVHSEYNGARVGAGWLKYDFQGTVWDLNDDADYTIFTWRMKPAAPPYTPSASPPLSSPFSPAPPSPDHPPTLFLHDPARPLPGPSAFCNPLFYHFRHRVPGRLGSGSGSTTGSPAASVRSGAKSTRKSLKSGRNEKVAGDGENEENVPKHKREFEQFHAENGVRTVIGTIGPVHNVRMLLKSGYRHVYVSRKFAIKYGFAPKDAAPGNGGYTGLVNIGKWPITLGRTMRGVQNAGKLTSVTLPVYLAEEEHFDVILGRSFHEARRVQTSALDPTDVRCMDTGEQVECELVVLRDGRGEIVTVT